MAKLLTTTPQIVFLVTAFIQAVVVLTMAGIAFKLVKENLDLQDPLQTSKYTTLSCYLALFIVTQVLELVMAVDALRLGSILQVVVILLLPPALTAMAAVYVSQIKAILVFESLSLWQCYRLFGPDECASYQTLWRQVQPYLIAVPSVLFATWLFMLLCAVPLYSEFRQDTLKAEKSRFSTEFTYQTYQTAVCMLKFTFFCFVGVLSQLLTAEIATDTTDFGLAIATTPVVFIILLILIFALRRNWTWLVSTSQLLMLGAMGYPYVVSRIFNPNIEAWYLEINQINIAFFIAVSLIALLVTLGMSIWPWVMILIRALVRLIKRPPRPQMLTVESSSNVSEPTATPAKHESGVV